MSRQICSSWGSSRGYILRKERCIFFLNSYCLNSHHWAEGFFFSFYIFWVFHFKEKNSRVSDSLWVLCAAECVLTGCPGCVPGYADSWQWWWSHSLQDNTRAISKTWTYTLSAMFRGLSWPELRLSWQNWDSVCICTIPNSLQSNRWVRGPVR